MTAEPSSSNVSPTSLRTRLTHGVAWQTTGVVFNQGSTFVLNVLLAHRLSQDVFGEYAMVLSTVQVAALLAQVATGYTATKYVAEFRSTDPDRVGRTLGVLAITAMAMAILTAAVLFFGAGWLARSVLAEPRLATALAVSSAGVLCSAISGFLMGCLAGLENYKALGLSGIVSGCSYVLAGVIGAWFADLTGAVAGIALSAAMQTLILWRAVRVETARQGIRIRASLHASDTDAILKFAIPAALNGFIAMPAVWMGNALLSRQPGGFAFMALFSAAGNFRTVVLFLPNIVNSVSMSLLNNQMGLRDARRYRRVFWTNLVAMVSIVTVAALLLSSVGRWLLSWFGPGFATGYDVLLVLMAVTIPESASTALFQILQSRARMWWSVAFVAIPCYGTLVAVAFWLVPASGAIGLAWAHLAAWTVALVGNLVIVSRLGLRLPDQAEAVASA